MSNFASAKNSGGGFLSGSQAQEESLARASGLYPSLLKAKEMYSFNRNRKSGLYSDYMIYSPSVPIFRDDNDNLISSPYLISFISSPAVNMTSLKKSDKKKANIVMLERIEKILSLATIHGYKHLVLGAWGCGVFMNNPENVAKYFGTHLKGKTFNGTFKKIIFSIYSRNPLISNPFKEEFQRHLQ